MNALPANTRIIVGMSGGVDSSVTALLLKQQGYSVSGIFMQNWEDDDEQCTARQDYRDASAVAAKLDIQLTTVNFAEEYWNRVFEHFLSEYSAGRTPNPDILCNKEIKFKAFLEHAYEQGAQYIATGHYVRSDQQSPVSLLRGLDANKDQSYFLYTLGQAQLQATLFPVGELSKPDVRAIAAKAGFHVANKKDSTGICFIGERKFTQFLADYLPAQPGDIVTDSGDTIGRHNGLMFHTLGQRQGLGIGGRQDSVDAPWFVLEKQLEENRLIVGQGHDHPALSRKQLNAHDVHWVAGQPPSDHFRATARVRYRQIDEPVSIEVQTDDTINAIFDQPMRAITPGQSIVMYSGDQCLGGAVISDLTPGATLKENAVTVEKSNSEDKPPPILLS
ncbi:MAG: tRNA 2-thiouridine(34) synthase MnmA [Granulosicoccus sp.]